MQHSRPYVFESISRPWLTVSILTGLRYVLRFQGFVLGPRAHGMTWLPQSQAKTLHFATLFFPDTQQQQ